MTNAFNVHVSMEFYTLPYNFSIEDVCNPRTKALGLILLNY